MWNKSAYLEPTDKIVAMPVHREFERMDLSGGRREGEAQENKHRFLPGLFTEAPLEDVVQG